MIHIFDLMPFGYANFAPLFTAICTCIILILLLVYGIIGKSRLAITARNILLISVVLSLCPLLFGIRYFSVVGGLITISLIAEWLLLYLTIKVPKRCEGA